MNTQKKVAFFKTDIGTQEEHAVMEVLRSGWLTTGQQTADFENAFKTYTGARNAVAVNSCTAALHLALESLDLTSDDEVITSPFTFSASASEIIHAGARLKFADINPHTGNIDPACLEQTISPRTKAVIPVHYAGLPCDMNEIMNLSFEYDLKIIEDAAHALESSFNSQKIGSIGDFTCFSFYATKNITTGEGGMLTCDNDALAEKIRILSLHGMSKDAWKRYHPTLNSGAKNYYQILFRGFKYNMSDIQAALGIVQLSRVDEFWEKRRVRAQLYRTLLQDIPEIELFDDDIRSKHAYHLMPVKLRTDMLTITRDQCIELLRQNGIGCSIHFIALHLHPYFQDTFGLIPSDFPNATNVSERVITLPLYPILPEEDVVYVVETIKRILCANLRKPLIPVT
ncbi:DegT/DnrJ/EryC1/StrS family aminotransferase [bacterium]|nr:DegT/DnrJ/EryC1/StrS family aminotransferase [bacterium]